MAILFRTIFCFCLLFSGKVFSNKTFVIYHDADYSINRDSALAMKMGLLTALNELDTKALGITIKLEEKNHRGNVNRSLKNLQKFVTDGSALFVLGGLHSPPYIKHRSFINEQKIPLFVPWAAGGPVTRYPSEDNWVFRLSIDDTKAGIRLSDHALNTLGCKQPQLFLEETPWGKSNFNTMSNYLDGKAPFDVTWFGWNLKQNAANIALRNAISGGADCIILVANYTESKYLLNGMLSLPAEVRVPIISHWGLTGGDVDLLVEQERRAELELDFIQSCFDFSPRWQTPFSQEVLTKAQALFPQQFDPNRLKAPAGFIQAFDLGLLLNQALSQLDYSLDIGALRQQLRDKVEMLKDPIQGLIKTYQMPFAPWSTQQTDAHEALGLADFCMAKFDQNNQILVTPNAL